MTGLDDDYPDCPRCGDNGMVSFSRTLYGGKAAEFRCDDCGTIFDTATPEMDFGGRD